MLKLGYNTTETAIVVDEDGHVIGGRSWGPYEDEDPAAVRESKAGRLIEADRAALAGSPRSEAQAAVAAFDAREAAARAVSTDDLEPAGGDDVAVPLEGGPGVVADVEPKATTKKSVKTPRSGTK